MYTEAEFYKNQEAKEKSMSVTGYETKKTRQMKIRKFLNVYRKLYYHQIANKGYEWESFFRSVSCFHRLPRCSAFSLHFLSNYFLKLCSEGLLHVLVRLVSLIEPFPSRPLVK
jgi:hypothetical protein